MTEAIIGREGGVTGLGACLGSDGTAPMQTIVKLDIAALNRAFKAETA